MSPTARVPDRPAERIAHHDWQIDPREYERQEQRRGRRHAYAHLDPARTALVVVDMVPFFVEQNPWCRGIVDNVATLASTLRDLGGTVAWVVPAAPPSGAPSAHAVEFFGERVALLHAASGGTADAPRDRIWAGFEPCDTDVFADKTAASAFFPGRSTLPPQLEARGIENVLVTGTVTNVCCEATARDASTLGYRVVFVADATAGNSDRCHNATLHTIYRTFGDVRATADVVGLLAGTDAGRDRAQNIRSI